MFFNAIPTLKKFNKKALDKIWKEHPLILHDTGQMYGIGGVAFDVKVAEKINKLKQRAGSKGFIVLIPDFTWLKRFGIKLNINQIRLIEQYWPGNVTFILPNNDKRLKHLAIGETVGFRVPTSKHLRDFIDLLDKPIISTSINHSNFAFENDYSQICNNYKNWFDFSVTNTKEIKTEATPSTIIGFDNDKLICHREGEIPFYELEESFHSPKIVFACTGNICRSPMAEFLAKDLISRNNLKFSVSSIGLLPSGNAISSNSYSVLEENGITARSHVSTQVSYELLREAWIVIVMEEFHRIELEKLYPTQSHKIFTMFEVSGEEGNIEDPYGKDIDEYRKTYAIISDKVIKFIDSLK